jgi:hypothetical protein
MAFRAAFLDLIGATSLIPGLTVPKSIHIGREKAAGKG